MVAQRYDAWAASAAAPALVEGLYLVVNAAPPGAAPALALRVWDAASQHFEEATAWPPPLDALRPHLEAHVARMAGGRDDRPGPGAGRERIERMMLPPQAPGAEGVLVAPIVRVSFPPRRDGARRELRIVQPDVALLGFTVLALDLDVLRSQVLPAAVRRHFYTSDGGTEYRIAVVDRDDPMRVLFESDPGAAAAVRARHDASVGFLGTRPGSLVFAARSLAGPPPSEDTRRPPRAGARDDGIEPGPDRVVVNVVEQRRSDERTTAVVARLGGGREGHWRLLVAHESGSLDAAVAAARRRNLLLSSGILLLLTVAIGLIVGSARRAEALARQQMEFVAAVTHELRTPVAVINSAAGNLADGVVGDPARVRRYGETIQAEARRLGDTVERVLQLAGLEATGGAVPDGRVAPDVLVREAIDACRGEIARAGATVEMDVPVDVPAIAGDAATLRIALQNLVGNAVKYGGERPRVRVSARTDRGEVRLAVEDRGLGIAAEDRPHVFEPFYRGREAVARQIQGSGLGLSLVRRIAEAHGGRVTFESEPGRGSTFTLVLRAAGAAPS